MSAIAIPQIWTPSIRPFRPSLRPWWKLPRLQEKLWAMADHIKYGVGNHIKYGPTGHMVHSCATCVTCANILSATLIFSGITNCACRTLGSRDTVQNTDANGTYVQSPFFTSGGNCATSLAASGQSYDTYTSTNASCTTFAGSFSQDIGLFWTAGLWVVQLGNLFSGTFTSPLCVAGGTFTTSNLNTLCTSGTIRGTGGSVTVNFTYTP